MGIMDKINTYGELLAEIERVEKCLEEIRSRPGYDYLEDDMDFIIYLNHLKKVKEYNERRYELMQELGLYSCDKCGSRNLEYETQRNIRIHGYTYAVSCEDCGYSKFVDVPDRVLRDHLPDVMKGLI